LVYQLNDKMSIKSKSSRTGDGFIQNTFMIDVKKLSGEKKILCSASYAGEECRNELKFDRLIKKYNFEIDEWDIYARLKCKSSNKPYLGLQESHNTIIILSDFIEKLYVYNEPYFLKIKKDIKDNLNVIKDFEDKKRQEIEENKKTSPSSYQILNKIKKYLQTIKEQLPEENNEEYCNNQEKCVVVA